MEDTIMNWAFSHMPTIAVCLLLMWFTGWVTIRIVNYQNRLKHLETDSGGLKKDVKSLKKSVARVDRKLDKLLTYLTATKKIDFKD